VRPGEQPMRRRRNARPHPGPPGECVAPTTVDCSAVTVTPTLELTLPAGSVIQGPQGQPGPQGPDGQCVSPTTVDCTAVTVTPTLELALPPGSVLQGPQGDQGPIGPPGPPGPQGLPGIVTGIEFLWDDYLLTPDVEEEIKLPCSTGKRPLVGGYAAKDAFRIQSTRPYPVLNPYIPVNPVEHGWQINVINTSGGFFNLRVWAICADLYLL